jgi:hypothetical protein
MDEDERLQLLSLFPERIEPGGGDLLAPTLPPMAAPIRPSSFMPRSSCSAAMSGYCRATGA